MSKFDLLVEFLKPIHAQYRAIINDERYLSELLAEGAAAANERAQRMVNRIHDTVGFIPLKT